MKKSVLSVVLLITMLISMIMPLGVSAATSDLKSYLDAKNIATIIAAQGYDHVYVPTNIMVREHKVAGPEDAYQEPALVLNVPYGNPANSKSFDFIAELDMAPVRDAFTKYYNGAKLMITSDNTKTDAQKQALLADLAAVPVTGGFMVVIAYNAGLDVDSTGFVAQNSMNGFKIKNGTSYSDYTENGNVYYENGVRTAGTNGSNWNTITLSIGVKSPNGGILTGGELAANIDDYLADLALECKAVAPTAFNVTYKVKGSVTGNTKLGDEATPIATIFYDAYQKGAADTTTPVSERSVSVVTTSPGYYPSGGGEKRVVVKFDVDGDTTVIGSLTLRAGSTVDFDRIERPTMEGYVFDGFYYDEAYTKPVSGKLKITKDSIFYARWIKEGSKALVVVDINGVTDEIGPIEYEIGSEVNFYEIERPVKEGYVFDGYYMDNEFTNKATGTITVFDDMVIYGRWIKSEAPEVLNSDEHLSYIAGYPNYEIRPFDNISREEVATIFYRILDKDKQKEFYAPTNEFTDVEDDRWSNDAISTIANGGYIIGYEDGTFRPEDMITRAEFVTIVARFYDTLIEKGTPYNDIDGHWAESYIITAASQGWIIGYSDGTFRPDEYITRADAIYIVNRLLVRAVNAEGLHEDTRQWIDNYEDSEYYYDILEATNSHDYVRQEDGYYETWTGMREDTFIIDKLYYEDQIN